VSGDSSVETTIVLPVWDDYVGTWLTEALESLQAQDSPARIVIIDNASVVAVPDTPELLVTRTPRRVTLGMARNLGLAEVTTPYVVVWDADDVMLPGTLAFLEAGIRADPRLAAFGTAILEDPSGTRHRWPRRWIAAFTRTPQAFALMNCVWSLYPTTGATIMRTELVRAAGGYSDAESGDDWCLGVLLAFRGRIGWSERPGRLYRIHNRSVWARHMTVRHQLRHAKTIRGRIRSDAGIVRSARVALPLIQLGQYLAILAHAGLDVARRLRPTRKLRAPSSS
jgi:glycosyltransferase involved in cell wall biosynthesis